VETLRFLFTSSFYPPYQIGGDANHVSHLAEQLAKRGHEVHVLHSLDAYKVKRRQGRRTKDPDAQHGVLTHPIETALSRSAYEAYIYGCSRAITNRFRCLVEEVKPDIVHHHNISLLGHSIFRKRSNYLNLYTAHDYWLVCPTNNLLRNRREICHRKTCFSCAIAYRRPPQIWRKLSRESFRDAIASLDLILSPSEYMRRRLLEEIEKEIITLPNFVPSPPTRILNKADEKPSNYFLFVGVLEPHKGIMELLKVFDEIRRDRDCGLAVVGDGSLMRSVNQFIVSRSLADRVWYEGFVDDARLYSLYKNALALIVPSVWPENAPLVALEALSVGTPVIGANNGGLPEIVGKVDGRLLFDNWEGLKKIVVEFSRTQFPSNTVRQIYESNFSPGKYVNEYMKIIRGQSG